MWTMPNVSIQLLWFTYQSYIIQKSMPATKPSGLHTPASVTVACSISARIVSLYVSTCFFSSEFAPAVQWPNSVFKTGLSG
ncbi:hypothetical protein D3C84_1174380 [compost metagenome]